MSEKKKRGCEVKIESTPRDVNKTGYNEEPAKYMANPKKGFWKTIDEAFKRKERKA